MDYVSQVTDYDLRVHRANHDLRGERSRNGKREVPIWEKKLLSLEEAAAYIGLGTQKLRDMSNDENCDFVLWNGNRRLFKRRKLDEYLDEAYSV